MDLTIKEKLFAQYWGQEVIYSPVKRGIDQVLSMEKVGRSEILGSAYLKLNDLSLLKDEDIKFVYTKVNGIGQPEGLHIGKYGYSNGIMSMEKVFCPKYNFLPDAYISVRNTFPEIIDYLRSKGYAVPYMGFSVEDQVKSGWVKLNL